MYSVQPPKAPACAMTTPLVFELRNSTCAVSVYERFFTLMKAFGPPVIDGKYMVLDPLFYEKILQLLKLCRVLGGKIAGLAEVFGDVVQLPCIFCERRILHQQPGDRMTRRGHPSVMIDGSVAKHLEILRGVALFGFRVVEAIDHRRTVERSLHSPIHALRER